MKRREIRLEGVVLGEAGEAFGAIAARGSDQLDSVDRGSSSLEQAGDVCSLKNNRASIDVAVQWLMRTLCSNSRTLRRRDSMEDRLVDPGA